MHTCISTASKHSCALKLGRKHPLARRTHSTAMLAIMQYVCCLKLKILAKPAGAKFAKMASGCC